GLAGEPDDPLVERFLAHVRARLGEVKSARFRDLLPAWLESFAREHGLAARPGGIVRPPTPADLEAGAVERVLRSPGEDESAWAGPFRALALAAPVRTAEALLAFAPPEVGEVPALASYRRDLFREARLAHSEALELFECDLPG